MLIVGTHLNTDRQIKYNFALITKILLSFIVHVVRSFKRQKIMLQNKMLSFSTFRVSRKNVSLLYIVIYKEGKRFSGTPGT